MTTVGVGIICHNRPTELQSALASVGDAGFAEIVVLDMASDPPLAPSEGTYRLLRSDENIGVSAGRNLLLQEARSDVVLLLDDDARLLAPHVHAAELVGASFADEDMAALAFRVVRPGGTQISAEHPFRGPVRGAARGRRCAYFLGGACALRRKAVLDCGGFDASFLYSTEEVELSFRLAGAGWQLNYEPRLVIEHRPSPRGRSSGSGVPAMRIRNRLLMIRRHLPWMAAAVHGAAWSARTLAEAVRVGGVKAWLTGVRDGMVYPTRRLPLDASALWVLHRNGGRVLW